MEQFFTALLDEYMFNRFDLLVVFVSGLIMGHLFDDLKRDVE